MIVTKEQFKEIINLHKTFNDELDKISETLFGNSYSSLIECKFAESANIMFDKFIEILLTEEGEDLLYWWIYEDVDKIIYYKTPDTLFEKGKEESRSVESFDNLWDYMIENKSVYFNGE